MTVFYKYETLYNNKQKNNNKAHKPKWSEYAYKLSLLYKCHM